MIRHFVARAAKAGLLVAGTLPLLATAASGTPPLPPGHTISPLDVGTLTHDPRKLGNTYVNKGNGSGSALVAGFNTLGTMTVNCGNAAGCHIGQESMVQLRTTGDWAICLLVDGSYTTCQYQGHLPDVGSYVVGNARGFSAPVAQGTHTVQTQVYVEVSGALYQWETDHRVYRP